MTPPRVTITATPHQQGKSPKKENPPMSKKQVRADPDERIAELKEEMAENAAHRDEQGEDARLAAVFQERISIATSKLLRWQENYDTVIQLQDELGELKRKQSRADRQGAERRDKYRKATIWAGVTFAASATLLGITGWLPLIAVALSSLAVAPWAYRRTVEERFNLGAEMDQRREEVDALEDQIIGTVRACEESPEGLLNSTSGQGATSQDQEDETVVFLRNSA